ncbi:16S rRNA (uracil(1498)-N(3))-methyltransferase [Paeniglutamicibacter sp. ABSL32-1]|uniref:16S rRNA (uracil(1498)-N(3))-methyltransferase n=1 Tax=Paeniglutamicibacter quisquiliarum TaxID=2849498 RepID=UPI001C2CC923|nr:16S rRNA (uracil(1498)-N(3))-methyltransferase [Paeniglutamicibacter quisquiliarum]MBV1778470.1 16S rRNA (uracil(1498)-N(3))-methyltransferase [Paeniglutamicibacter quisquiliarum]
MSNQCFFLAPGELKDARVGAGLRLEGPEGHHAVTVKRVRVGESIDLVDGTGVRAVAEVTATQKAALDAVVRELESEALPPLAITLVQALAKGDRDLQAVESAVELGIDAVRPWQSDRAIVRWNDAKAAKALTKWEGTVLAALKQSRRTFLPEVRPMLNSADLAREIAGRVSGPDPVLVIVLHEAGTESLSAVVARWLDENPVPASAVPGKRPEIQLVVGPEGGISDAEIQKFTAAGAQVALLGRHVLRASTAGPAALVLTRHLAGQL